MCLYCPAVPAHLPHALEVHAHAHEPSLARSHEFAACLVLTHAHGTQLGMARLTVVELFAGMGGVTGGLLDAGGFEPLLLLDSDPHAALVFRTNFAEVGDRYKTRAIARQMTATQLLDLAGGHPDGILGCPPCQGLSPAGLRDVHDSRNDLLLEMRRLIRGVRPRFFIMENVPSLLLSTQYAAFEAELIDLYDIHAEVLNAAEYGVPQLRRRAVVVGFHRELGVTPSLPEATHGGIGRVFDYRTGGLVAPHKQKGRNLLKLRPHAVLPKRPLVTLADALGDLPFDPPPLTRRVRPCLAVEDAAEYARPPKTAYQHRMRRGSAVALNHRAWRHTTAMVAWLRCTEPGDCPSDQGERGRNTRYYSQAYARLHARGLARTITTNFHNPGGGRFTHYGSPRTLTLREALRVQGFGDAYRFDDLHASDAERLVGNAFPRLLAEAIGRHVASLLAPLLGTEAPRSISSVDAPVEK